MVAARAFCAPDQQAPRPSAAHLGARGQACNDDGATGRAFYLRLVSGRQAHFAVTAEPAKTFAGFSLAANKSGLSVYCDDGDYEGRCTCGRCHIQPFRRLP